MKKYIYDKIIRPEMTLTPRLSAVNPICLDILYRRGFRTAVEMENFLFPSLVGSLKSHPAMLDTDKAVKILIAAATQKLPVVIYHDYDVDGITAAAVTYSCLHWLGVPVNCYCNERSVDGFGICAAGVDNLKAAHPDTKVLITVDNGISGLDGVARAKELGLQVIVTDHHEPDGAMPAGDAIVDHKRPDEPEGQDKNCCGAGVAWKVMLELYMQLGQDVGPVLDALDLVALGTIADIVPLLGDNRAMVREGLKLINEGRRPFFRVAAEILELPTIDEETIAFRLAPMINAVSRMGRDVPAVVRLLLNTNRDELVAGIIALDEVNQERKSETAKESEIALSKIQEDFNKAVIVVRDDGFEEGIIGIIAGQLKERYGLPAAVFAQDRDGNWRGSCRSHDGFHLKQALDECSEYLLAYGGHAKGAGLTVRASDFEAFQAKFEALAAKAAQETPYEEQAVIDTVLSAAAFTEESVRELSILAPFGEGFPKPLFGLIADIVGTRYMGNEGQHVKYTDRTGLSVIQWRQGERARARKNPPAKFVGFPGINVFRGYTSVQFIAE